jgi:outer membrane protein
MFRALLAALVGIAVTLICPSDAKAADAPAGSNDPIYGNTLRLGIYAVFYHTTADDITGALVPPGVNLNLKTDDLVTPYAAYVRRLSTHFALELALGLPPLTKSVGVGPATLGSVPYNGQVISTARWFAPTILLNYVFFDDNTALRPYIGVGVNYTAFYDRDSTAAGNAATGGPTKLELPSSVGPSGTLGLSYRIAPHWGVYASYSITRVDTTLTADTAGLIRTTHIRFGPQALVLAAGYSF